MQNTTLFKDTPALLTNKRKLYRVPPLPFMGNKKNAVNLIESFIKEFKAKSLINEKDLKIIDVFGGSGLISHIFKYYFTNSKVIYNDFSDYKKRIENIHITNEILRQIKEKIIFYKTKINEKLSKELKNKILDIIKSFDNDLNFIDYYTLSSHLLFACNYAYSFKDLEKANFYYKNFNVKKEANGYLDGLIIVKKDYKELINEYKEDKNALLILDPPYMQTNQDGYQYDLYFDIKEYNFLIKNLRKPFIIFSSEKSQILDLFDLINHFNAPFKNIKIKSYNLSYGHENQGRHKNEKLDFTLKQEKLKTYLNKDYLIYEI